VPIEEYADQIGCNIVPAIRDVGEIVEAWPGLWFSMNTVCIPVSKQASGLLTLVNLARRVK
jgi:hypothetical protein